MKKLLIVAVIFGLGLAYSCKKGEKKEEPKPEKPAPAQPSPVPGELPKEPEGKIIPPEAFYKFEVDRLALLKDHKSKFEKLLKAAKAKDDALIDKVIEANKAIISDFIALTEKDGVKAEDYKKTTDDADAQKANQDYIASHPEIDKRMKELQQEVVKIEQGISAEVTRLKISQEDMIKRATPPAVPQTPAEPKSEVPKTAPEPPATPAK